LRRGGGVLRRRHRVEARLLIVAQGGIESLQRLPPNWLWANSPRVFILFAALNPLMALCAPATLWAPGRSCAPAILRPITYGGVTQEDRQSLAEANAAAEESCNGLAPGVTDFPVARIKQVVQPTGDQLTALNDLSAAAAKANDIIKASCPTAVPLTPVARLDTAEARLEAVT
jgi:hypothetical protein